MSDPQPQSPMDWWYVVQHHRELHSYFSNLAIQFTRMGLPDDARRNYTEAQHQVEVLERLRQPVPA